MSKPKTQDPIAKVARTASAFYAAERKFALAQEACRKLGLARDRAQDAARAARDLAIEAARSVPREN